MISANSFFLIFYVKGPEFSTHVLKIYFGQDVKKN